MFIQVQMFIKVQQPFFFIPLLSFLSSCIYKMKEKPHISIIHLPLADPLSQPKSVDRYPLDVSLPRTLTSVVGQRLIVVFRPLPTEWHRLGPLIELGWRSNSNVQQMAGACLHWTGCGSPLSCTLLCPA